MANSKPLPRLAKSAPLLKLPKTALTLPTTRPSYQLRGYSQRDANLLVVLLAQQAAG